ncbi:MAG: hypothetical protein V4858_27625 [Pseudomonadota bacterium]
MSSQTRVADIAATLLGPRERSGRWIYLVAMLLPAWGTLNAVLSSFPTYGYQHWVSASLVVICGAQFYRPRLALWLPVFVWYAWASLGAIWDAIDRFQDYGSEDHGRWEGWHTERMFLSFTAFLIYVTVQVSIQIRRRPLDAT